MRRVTESEPDPLAAPLGMSHDRKMPSTGRLPAQVIMSLQRSAGNSAVVKLLSQTNASDGSGGHGVNPPFLPPYAVQCCGSTPCDCQADSGGSVTNALPEAGREAPVIQRQPTELPNDRPDPNIGLPPNVGPPVSEVPKPPIVSIISKDGKLYWKVEGIPGISKTPEIPLDPRDIPEEARKLLKKVPGGGTPGGPPGGFPPSPPIVLPPNWLADICKRESGLLNPKSESGRLNVLCQIAMPKPPTPTPILGPPPRLGPLWTDRVIFERNRPESGTPGSNSSLTAEGRSSLDSILSWLKLSPNLRVRLIGNCSFEGDTDHNQQLSNRRVLMILRELEKAGFGLRVQDPLLSDGKEAGCQNAGRGMWACGALKASSEEARSEDRAVEVTFFHDLVLNLEPPTLGPIHAGHP
jgi:hypothetical protein